MNKKKVIIPLVTAGIVVCGIGGYKIYQDRHDTVDVIPVSALNNSYWGDSQSLSGMVYDSENQSITLDGTATVSEVYVSQGQSVKAGDRLLSYDIRDLELSVEMKKLAVEQAQNQLQGAQNRLKVLKNTKPRQEVVIPTPEPTVEPTVTPAPTATPDQDDHGLYTYVDSLSDAFTDNAEHGYSIDDPIRFACSENAVISMQVIQEAKTLLSDDISSVYLSFEGYELSGDEIFDADTDEEKMVTKWLIKVKQDTFADKEDTDTFDLISHQEEEPQETPEPTPDETEEPEIEEPQGYTAAELATMIRDAEASVRSQDLDVRRKQLDLQSSEKALQDGTVYAAKDGVVTKVGDPANPPQDGSAFLVVSAAGGTMIQGQISELMLDQLHTGDTLSATDWNTDMSYDAIVQSIDTVPASGNSYYGGNPNVSYYNFYALVDGENDLQTYSGLDLSMPYVDNTKGYWIDVSYVRKENDSYYVMKDNNGRLKKQPVSVGATMYGSIINVKDGITDDDKLAFPYGKNVKEGARTQEASEEEYYG